MNVFDIKASAANPALLAFCDKFFLSASYALYFQETSFNSLNINIPLKSGVHGINLLYAGFNYGEMDSYIDDGAGGYLKTGTFGASDFFTGVSYEKRITYDVYAGLNMKYIRQSIDASAIEGFALSASGIYMPDKTWYMAGGIDNAGPATDGYSIDSSAYLAFTDKPEELNSMFAYGFELRFFFDNTFWLKTACEFNYEQLFFARLGYNFPLNNDNASLGEWYEKNLSAGFGFEYGFLSVDYAWLAFGDLGNTNMLSLCINF